MHVLYFLIEANQLLIIIVFWLHDSTLPMLQVKILTVYTEGKFAKILCIYYLLWF